MANRIFLRVGTWYRAIEKYLSTDLEITDVVDDPEAEFPEVVGDGGGGGEIATVNYLVYTALLTQAGTDAPTVIVLHNTLNEDIVWTRSGVGNYVGTIEEGNFLEDNTFMQIASQYLNNWYLQWNDENSVFIATADNTGAPSDDILFKTAIEIRVYP